MVPLRLHAASPSLRDQSYRQEAHNSEQMRSFRQQYLTQRSGQDLARSVRDSNSNQDWIAFNVIGVEHYTVEKDTH